MAKRIIRVSEAQAADDFPKLLACVREGSEVVIEANAASVAVLRAAEPPVRLLSDSLRLARLHSSTATLDAEFSKDLEAAIESRREPLEPPAWD